MKVSYTLWFETFLRYSIHIPNKGIMTTHVRVYVKLPLDFEFDDDYVKANPGEDILSLITREHLIDAAEATFADFHTINHAIINVDEEDVQVYEED